MLDLYIGVAIIAGVIGFCVGCVFVGTLAYRAWQDDVVSIRTDRDCLRARLADADLENVRLNEEADWAAVIARSEHPSLGLRPVAAVVSLDERRGGA